MRGARPPPPADEGRQARVPLVEEGRSPVSKPRERVSRPRGPRRLRRGPYPCRPARGRLRSTLVPTRRSTQNPCGTRGFRGRSTVGGPCLTSPMTEAAQPRLGSRRPEPRRAARRPRRRRPPCPPGRPRQAPDRPPVGRAAPRHRRLRRVHLGRRGTAGRRVPGRRGLPAGRRLRPRTPRRHVGRLAHHRDAADRRRPRPAAPAPGDLGAGRVAGGAGVEGPPGRPAHPHPVPRGRRVGRREDRAPAASLRCPAAGHRPRRGDRPLRPRPARRTRVHGRGSRPGTSSCTPRARRSTPPPASSTSPATPCSSPTSTGRSAATPRPRARPATTARSASARSRRWPPCSPVVETGLDRLVEPAAKRAISRDPTAQDGALPAPRPDRPRRRRPGEGRPGRAPRPGHHRQDPRVGRQLPRPDPAGHPDGRRRRRRRPRPTRPDARPGHPERPDLPVPELPGRLTPLRPRPHRSPTTPADHPARPDQATSCRSADDTTTPRPAVCGATPARPKATAPGPDPFVSAAIG